MVLTPARSSDAPAPVPSSALTARGLGALLALLLVAGVLGATPAWAAPGAGPSDMATLQGALGACEGTAEAPTTVVVSGDIEDRATTLTIGCAAELDLNGHTVRVRNVRIEDGEQLAIDDTGTTGSLVATDPAYEQPGIRTSGAKLIIKGGHVTARATGGGAGIGGTLLPPGTPDSESGGVVSILGGTVDASGHLGAGIGGAGWGSGGSITISGGTVTASSDSGAGIGGGYNRASNTITIDGGEVTASSSAGGAGIGGGYAGSNGTVVVNDGVVRATGTASGAGIGGGWRGLGGTITIDDGIVRATGGASAAGIGGGENGRGAMLTIGEDAVVTTSGGASAVGPGADSDDFGRLQLAGTLRLPTGELRVPDSSDAAEITLASSGLLLGDAGDPQNGAEITGSGQIANGGAVLLDPALVLDGGVQVLGNNFRVSYDTQGASSTPAAETLLAPSFTAAGRTLPADLTRGTDPFKGWNTAAAGSGMVLRASSTLPGSSSDGQPVAVTAFARWSTGLSIDTGLPGGEARVTTTTSKGFTARVLDSDGDRVATDPGSWSVADAGGKAVTTVDPTSGAVTVASAQTGTHDLTLSTTVRSQPVTTTVRLVVGLNEFAIGPTASFTGTLRVGQSLVADAGTVAPAPDNIAYTWFADGAQVGAGPAYTLTAGDEGKQISVRAVASKAAYIDASDTSAPVGPVAHVRAPSVDLRISEESVRLGESVRLQWSATDADVVTASGAWAGSKPASGSESVKPAATGAHNYSLTATNDNGSVTTVVSVQVRPAAKRLDVGTNKGWTTVGGELRTTATGLAAGERYEIRLGGHVVATGAATDAGSVSRRIVVPGAVKAGRRTLTITGSEADRTGATSIRVLAVERLEVSFAHRVVRTAGINRVTVRGLLPHERVRIDYDGRRISPSGAKAGADGVYRMRFEVGRTPGVRTLVVTGAHDGRSTEGRFEIRPRRR